MEKRRARPDEILDELISKLPKPSNGLIRMTSRYLDKVKEAHQILSIIDQQVSYRVEHGKEIPVSARKNLEISLNYMRSQVETVEKIV